MTDLSRPQRKPQPPARLLGWPLLLAVSALLLSMLPGACGPSRAVVRVGEQTITEDELQQALVLRAGPTLLLEMIDTELILQAAAKEGVTVADQDMERRYAHAVARVGSATDFEARLKQLRRTKEEYRTQLHADALLDYLALRRLNLTEADLRRYYEEHLQQFAHDEQVRARLILMTRKEDAEAVREALDMPEADFAGLAKAFSEDPATKEQGGGTGFFARKDYAAELSDVAFRLQPGEISPVIVVPDGYAVLKVEAKRPAGAVGFEEVKSGVRARMEMEQLDGARNEWLRMARREAKLVIPNEALGGLVRALIEADTPFDPTNLTPEMPVAPR